MLGANQPIKVFFLVIGSENIIVENFFPVSTEGSSRAENVERVVAWS